MIEALDRTRVRHQNEGMPRRKLSPRELIEPHPGDKRYIRRDEKGRIATSVDLNRSLSADDRRKAKNVAKPGQGDRGDERRRRRST
jgi:hypothetical protein